jgi:two-component system sensor histidine kinase PilS (NtrC family)
LQIVWDLFFVTLLLLLTGGINSPFSFLYTLSIINASFLLTRRDAIYTASLCGILYGAILDLQYYGKLSVFGLSEILAQQYGANYIFYTIFVNILAFYLTAFLTGYLAERARKSETALQEKEIDYKELERLYSSIVFNLESGLLTINNSGRIRVFNRYAAELTGVSQEEAYDKRFIEIFPTLAIIDFPWNTLQRGEMEFLNMFGAKKILGYKLVPFTDQFGNGLGCIFDFQDLTEIKRMESELKKADRLAALGELSARIAHEIRNPLTSISGSVQLIAQGDSITEKDKRLIDIVIRETDRLNELIKDFLAYARPTQPIMTSVNIKSLLRDVMVLVVSDIRFKNISINNNLIEDTVIYADENLIEQVFWNLFVNSAEAMPHGGAITIDAEIVLLKEGNKKQLAVSVSDTGMGMVVDKMDKVFEPFFTTKKNGTGLGLATVYRILEAHGGSIRLESTEGKGTKFTLYLPISQ